MKILELWNTRRQAERALSEELVPCADISYKVFSIINGLVTRLEGLNQPFGRVCALILLKARNLGFGCYSLFLDALGQEAGALFRPMLECIELLMYFRLDPNRINEALEDRLPSAGYIAKRVEGQFQFIREYLNANASHISLSPEANTHLIDFRKGSFQKDQLFNKFVLEKNILLLLSILVWIEVEAVNCIFIGEQRIDSILTNQVEELKKRVLILHDQQNKQ